MDASNIRRIPSRPLGGWEVKAIVEAQRSSTWESSSCMEVSEIRNPVGHLICISRCASTNSTRSIHTHILLPSLPASQLHALQIPALRFQEVTYILVGYLRGVRHSGRRAPLVCPSMGLSTSDGVPRFPVVTSSKVDSQTLLKVSSELPLTLRPSSAEKASTRGGASRRRVRHLRLSLVLQR
jgi:hypothetical protein